MRSVRRRGAIAATAAAALLVPAVGLVGTAEARSEGSPSSTLRAAVTLDATLHHLRNLQKIADVNGSTRAAGTPGHAASAGYVAGQLAAAGYDVQFQSFDFPFFRENSDAVLERGDTAYAVGEDFATMTYSGSGDVTAAVQPVDLQLPPPPETGSTSGCEQEDFADFVEGNIAVLQRGICTFGVKATNAQAAGASAVIIFNEGQEGRTDVLTGTLGAPVVDIPVLGTTFAVGVDLAEADGEVHIVTDTTVETRRTYNVIAETKPGRADNVVMTGAHLDSVTKGPGINDNGSGSAAQLEVALQFAKTVKDPKNKVRFAWWSAEEYGLLGSEAYVASLEPSQLGDIALYLNFDMVASPNFARLLYDGDDSDQEGAGPGPEGSAAIEKVFQRYFGKRGLPTEGTDFDGRSDYGPFIAAGIPSGGIFTGAEGIKTPEQVEKYGGTAGVAYDPCYHQACDTTRNIDNTALAQNADAIAHAIATFAFDTTAVNGRAVAGDRSPRPTSTAALAPYSTRSRAAR